MTSMNNEFQIALAALRNKYKQVATMMRTKDQLLWRNLEYGDKIKITQLAQEFDLLRQQFEKLDDGQRYAQDVSSNIQLFQTGKASNGLKKKYDRLAALRKIIQSGDYDGFFNKYPPSQVLDIQLKQLTDESMPDYIRRYMVENKVQSPVFDKVCDKFPLPELYKQANPVIEPKPVTVSYPAVFV